MMELQQDEINLFRDGRVCQDRIKPVQLEILVIARVGIKRDDPEILSIEPVPLFFVTR